MSEKVHEGFGSRSIGMIGGVSLLLNNCLGPGVAQMPALFQKAGWIACTIALLIFAVAAFLAGWMLMYAQSRIPISLPRTEYGGICKYFLPRGWFIFTQVFFILTMIVLCVGGVLQTSQLMDFLFVRIFKKSCAIQIYPNVSLPCASDSDGFSVFPSGTSVISAGYVAAALVTIPFGFFPLEDNIKFQVFSCCAMTLCVLLWIADFSMMGLHKERVPAWGESLQGLVGACMFNFCISFSLPSWNNERVETVGVKKSLAAAILIATGFMWVIGCFAGTAFDVFYKTSKNLNDVIDEENRWMSVSAMYLFSLANNITSIPVFSICIRYCLVELDIMRKYFASLLSVLLPWILVIPFSTGEGFSNIIEYGGMVFLSVTGFIIPPFLFYLAIKKDKELTFDGVTDNSELREHPSRSGSIIANQEFELIYGKRNSLVAQSVALVLLAVLFSVGIYSLVYKILLDLSILDL